MKLTPLKQYKSPRYPTREIVLSDPSCLNECVPTRWKGNKIVTTMLAVYLLGPERTEAQVGGAVGDQPVLVRGDKPGPVKNSEQVNERQPGVPSIAPIFLHGDGRGSTGCVIMNPPLFLSEGEARQIIEEELMREHIIFDKKNVKLDDVVIREEHTYGKGEENQVNLDGYSSKYNLGYEVVTVDDYHALGGPYSSSTVHSYDLVKAAENLRNKMREYGKMNVAVFYDPVQYRERDEKNNSEYEHRLFGRAPTSDEDDIRNEGKRAKRKSIELLKQQVSDFIQWIKQEGLFEK